MDLNMALELYQIGGLNQTLFNHHPDAIYILDLEGNFRMVNEKVCKVVGLEREQLIGKSFEPLIQEEYMSLTRHKFELAIQEKPQRYETAIVTSEGVIYLDITNFPLKVEGKVLGTFGIAKDVTLKRKKEHELQEYAALLKARNEELEVLRNILAHDLRKPVANAIGFSKLLEAALLPPEKEREVKNLLLKTVESVDAMVRDLNEIVALKSVGRESKEQILVHASLENILSLFANEIMDIHASVTLRVEPGLYLNTVKGYFNSIMRNLLSNALKYHTPHSKPSVLVTAVGAENGIEIGVQDNGVGMDMASMSEDLFKMHKRFAPSLAEGNGLGLYIVNEQVKLLGGTISVTSAPGVGSEFKIFLPTGI
ncbi:sensor histidine kinase [Pontibacter brevis]